MDSSACSIVEVAVSRALEDEAVSILTKGKGIRVLKESTALGGIPADLLALTLQHTLAGTSSKPQHQRRRCMLSCVLASDDMVTDMVLATQLTECDSTLTPCEAVCMASSALAGWHGNAARQHVQTVNDVNKTIKAVQVMLSERNLVEFWRGHTRVHTVVTLHLEPTAHSGARQTSSSTSVRFIGLTGVPDVSLREALQLSHSEQDPLYPAPADLGEGLWSLIQPVRDKTHRVWLVVHPKAQPNQPSRADWQLQLIFNHTPLSVKARLSGQGSDDDDDVDTRCHIARVNTRSGSSESKGLFPHELSLAPPPPTHLGPIAPSTPARSTHTTHEQDDSTTEGPRARQRMGSLQTLDLPRGYSQASFDGSHTVSRSHSLSNESSLTHESVSEATCCHPESPGHRHTPSTATECESLVSVSEACSSGSPRAAAISQPQPTRQLSPQNSGLSTNTVSTTTHPLSEPMISPCVTVCGAWCDDGAGVGVGTLDGAVRAGATPAAAGAPLDSRLLEAAMLTKGTPMLLEQLRQVSAELAETKKRLSLIEQRALGGPQAAREGPVSDEHTGDAAVARLVTDAMARVKGQVAGADATMTAARVQEGTGRVKGTGRVPWDSDDQDSEDDWDQGLCVQPSQLQALDVMVQYCKHLACPSPPQCSPPKRTTGGMVRRSSSTLRSCR